MKAPHATWAVGRFLLKPLMRSSANCRSSLNFLKSTWQLAGMAWACDAAIRTTTGTKSMR
ncbi:MAG: hypothetical protein CTY25_03045 [Methylobacterium sp.]|nr:MAG: hypothetical protein CTY25_03045 [Methylobacterium sp.]